DEIQTGVGRTGRLWAYEHAGVEPDVMTLAKALANGVPIGAMLCRDEATSVLTAGSHGSTFGGTPFVTQVALATLTTVIGDKLPERAARMGRELMDGLLALQPACPVVKQVRGRGLLIGAELSTPAAPIVDACREAGLLVLSAGESVPDVPRNLSRWVAGSAARVFAHATVDTLARHASIPVINALSDFEHPCQAIADWFTLWERGLDPARTRLAWIGNGNNVCHS